jgi:hypothetical protein
VLPSLLIDCACPFLTYKLLRAYVPGMSEVLALAAGAVFPLGYGVLQVLRTRRLDFIGIVVLVGIAVSLVGLWIGGSPRVFLIRESFVTGALGLLALSSFTWRRPMMFYVGRQFSSGDDPASLARFNGLWELPRARRTFRLLTAVWSVAWLGEFGLRVLMVFTLSVAQVLAIGPVVFNGITFGLMAWTFAYVRRQQRGRTEPSG